MKKVFLFTLLIFHLTGFSQTKKQLLQMANKAYNLQDYYSAINLYENYLQAFPNEIEIEFRLAKSYIELNDFEKAIEPLNHIYKIDRDRKYPETSLLLANSYKQTANYRYAKRYFRRALTKYRRQKESFEYQKINQEIKSCDFAQLNYSLNKTGGLINLGAAINSTNADFAFAQINSNRAIFAATDTFGTKDGTIAYSKLFWAKKAEDEWVRNGIISLPKEYAHHNVVNPYYDPESKLLYFSDCDTLHQCVIKTGILLGESLTEIKPLNDKINLPFTNNTQPAIAIVKSDKYLLFSSNREGGLGGMDIWYSKYLESDWIDPINIGSEVNSIDQEINPFYYDNSLYFSSNWHKGFGGFDVFKSEGNLKKQSTAENVLQPINSISNDLYYRIYDDFAYLTTNRTGSMTFKNDNCCNDLYSISLQIDTTKIKHEETYQTINALFPLKLYFDNDLPKKNQSDTTTNAVYTTLLDQYINKKNTYVSHNLKGLKKEAAMDTEDELLDFFDFLLPQGKMQLEETRKFIQEKLNKNEDVTLIVRGYSSALANSEYNFKLSQRRINSLFNYLNYSTTSSLNKGNFKIIALPMGDLVSTENRLDVKKDKVFGLDAIYQRKIEIVGLVGANNELENDRAKANLKLPNPIINLGKIKSKNLNYSLTIQNTGNAELELIKIIGADLKSNPTTQLIQPNESTTLELQFEFSENRKTGKSVIYFVTNDFEGIKSIEFKYEN